MRGGEETVLTAADLKQIRETVESTMDDQKKNFWIDAELHYMDHANLQSLEPEDIHSLRDLVRAYRFARKLFWRAFLGAAIIGSLALTAVGMGFEK